MKNGRARLAGDTRRQAARALRSRASRGQEKGELPPLARKCQASQSKAAHCRRRASLASWPRRRINQCDECGRESECRREMESVINWKGFARGWRRVTSVRMQISATSGRLCRTRACKFDSNGIARHNNNACLDATRTSGAKEEGGRPPRCFQLVLAAPVPAEAEKTKTSSKPFWCVSQCVCSFSASRRPACAN